MADWEAERAPLEAGESDDDALFAALHEAKRVYGRVAGWTQEPQPHRKRVLPGHQKLQRELDVLGV